MSCIVIWANTGFSCVDDDDDGDMACLVWLVIMGGVVVGRSCYCGTMSSLAVDGAVYICSEIGSF